MGCIYPTCTTLSGSQRAADRPSIQPFATSSGKVPRASSADPFQNVVVSSRQVIDRSGPADTPRYSLPSVDSRYLSSTRAGDIQARGTPGPWTRTLHMTILCEKPEHVSATEWTSRLLLPAKLSPTSFHWYHRWCQLPYDSVVAFSAKATNLSFRPCFESKSSEIGRRAYYFLVLFHQDSVRTTHG